MATEIRQKCTALARQDGVEYDTASEPGGVPNEAIINAAHQNGSDLIFLTTRPVVRTRTGLHADQARRQRGDHLVQFIARDRRTHQRSASDSLDALDGKIVLGEIDANGNNGYGLPLSE